MTNGGSVVCKTCGRRTGAGVKFDYCSLCGRTLCAACMNAGCCGMEPAPSGRKEDLPFAFGSSAS